MKSLLLGATIVASLLCLSGAEGTVRGAKKTTTTSGKTNGPLPDAPTMVKSISLPRHTSFEDWSYDGVGTTYVGGNKLYFNYANISDYDKPFWILQIDLDSSDVAGWNLNELYSFTVTKNGEVIVATEPYGEAGSLYGYGAANWTTKLTYPLIPKGDSPGALFNFDTVVGDDNNIQVFTYENSMGDFRTALLDTTTGAPVSFSKYQWFEHAHFLAQQGKQQNLPEGTCFVKQPNGVEGLFSYTKYWYIASFPNITGTSDPYDQDLFLGCADVNPASAMCFYYIGFNKTTNEYVNRLGVYDTTGLIKEFHTGSRVKHAPYYNPVSNTLSIAAEKELLVYHYTSGLLGVSTTFNAPDCSSGQASHQKRAIWRDYIVSYTFQYCNGYFNSDPKNFTIYNYSSGAPLYTESLQEWPHSDVETLGDTGYFLAPSGLKSSENHNRRYYEIRSFKTGQKVFAAYGYAFQHLEEKNQFAIFYSGAPHHLHDSQVVIYQYANSN